MTAEGSSSRRCVRARFLCAVTERGPTMRCRRPLMTDDRLKHVYAIRSRKDRRGVDLISNMPFGALWDNEPSAVSNTIGYAKFFSLSHDAGQRNRRRLSPYFAHFVRTIL